MELEIVLLFGLSFALKLHLLISNALRCDYCFLRVLGYALRQEIPKSREEGGIALALEVGT